MKKKESGIGGRMNDFEFVVIKEGSSEGKKGTEGKKAQDKK